MNVIASRKRIELSKDDPEINHLYSFEEVETLFSESDYLVSAAPLTKETTGFINASKFKQMKKSAVFINVGRGPVVTERDLISALRDKTIKGAALDVFEKEPLDKDSPLWRLENVLVSPHIADRHDTWLANSMQCFIDNCKRFVQSKQLHNIVNLELGY